MTYRHIDWAVDDLYVLAQYPRKSLRELSRELKMHPNTVARKLREQGHEIMKRGGRKRRESPPIFEQGDAGSS
jgi:hypothetical protein